MSEPAKFVTENHGLEDIPDEPLWISTIEEGIYRLRYVAHRESAFRSQPKLELVFSIVDGAYDGEIVIRYYNVFRTPAGKIRPAGRGCHLRRELVKLFPAEAKSLSLTRIPYRKLFSMHDLRGHVVMCDRDSEGETLPEGARLPKVYRLLGIWKEQGVTIARPCKTELDPSVPIRPNPSLTQPTLVSATKQNS